MRPSTALICLLIPVCGMAGGVETEYGGHTKLRLVGQAYPADSVYRALAGSTSVDASAALRLKFAASADRWSFDSAYQLLGIRADTLALTPLPSDERRLFGLTDVISRSDDGALVQRLDRIWVGYASEKAVVRFGRQALSWGNGLAYAPMDLVNPFDPASVDTEYKAGDDMLYFQYLQDNGNDIQGAWVLRRNPDSGNVDSEESTAAAKYHGFAGTTEFDLLVAQSYGDTVLGTGISRDVGGAVWSADLVLTRTERDSYLQVVSNLLYSWVWAGRNMSGGIEYYFNGFGQGHGRYDPASLAANPDLTRRLLRRELFGLGRHYVAGNVLIEINPLWTLTPSLLVNIEDPSALLQLITSYSLGDNLSFLASLDLPVGPGGSEFGGIETGPDGLYLSRDAGVFVQLAWYF